jgi:hypothetical protein
MQVGEFCRIRERRQLVVRGVGRVAAPDGI